MTFLYGNPGDRQIMGDWNGDGVRTPGVFRGGTWYLRNSNSAGVAEISFQFANADDIPLAGDWNGDGKDTVGVFRPSSATFYFRNLITSGGAEATRDSAIPTTFQWSGTGTTTVPTP